MKARIPAALCLALLLALLTACSPTYEYLKITEHNDPFAYREETQTETTAVSEEVQLSAGDYYSLRAAISSLVTQGVEHGRIILSPYAGSIEDDLKKAVAYLTEEDPIGAYAVDFINYDLKKIEGREQVEIDAVYRRSASEIAAIRPVRGTEQAEQQIFDALNRFDTAVTLRVSGYVDYDYEACIRTYCITHPDKVVAIPATTFAVYPQTGNVRIVELHLSYGMTKEEMHSDLTELNSVFSSAFNYLRYGETQRDQVNLACAYLAGRFDYVHAENATVYELLCEGSAGSLATAAAFRYLCQRAGMDCRLIEGTKNQADYAWNVLLVDGVWYHADIMEAVLTDRREPELLLDRDMAAYQWDREAVPVCDGTPLDASGEN